MWLEKLNDLRKKSGLSLDEISEKSGVPKGTLSKITSGVTKSPSIETVKAIVYCMGYTLQDLDDPQENGNLAASFSKDEISLVDLYRGLNSDGQEKVTEYTEDISKLPKYKKQQPVYKIPIAARTGVQGEAVYTAEDMENDDAEFDSIPSRPLP